MAFRFPIWVSGTHFQDRNLLRSLCKVTDVVNQVPAVGIGDVIFPRRHARSGQAVRDPIEELGISMHPRNAVFESGRPGAG